MERIVWVNLCILARSLKEKSVAPIRFDSLSCAFLLL